MTKYDKWTVFIWCGLIISLNVSQSLIDLFETFIIGTVLYTAFKSKTNPFKSIPRPLTYSLLFFFLTICLSYIFGTPGFSEAKVKGILEFRLAIVILSCIVLITQTNWTRTLLNYLLFSFSLATIMNFSYYFLADQDRAGGLFRNPMFFAQNLGPFLLVLLSVALFQQSNYRNSENKKIAAITALTFLLGFVLLLLTQTRGVWLGFATAVFTSVYFMRNKLIVIAATVLFILCTVIFFLSPTMKDRVTLKGESNNYSRAVRPIIWLGHLEIFKKFPITGSGYNLNNYLYFDTLSENEKSVVEKEKGLQKTHAHNQYVQFLAGTGILGFIAYLIFLGVILNYAIKAVKKYDKSSFSFFLSSGLLAGLICFLIASLTECNFSISKNRSLFLVLAAASLALATKKEKRSDSNEKFLH